MQIIVKRVETKNGHWVLLEQIEKDGSKQEIHIYGKTGEVCLEFAYGFRQLLLKLTEQAGLNANEIDVDPSMLSH